MAWLIIFDDGERKWLVESLCMYAWMTDWLALILEINLYHIYLFFTYSYFPGKLKAAWIIEEEK